VASHLELHCQVVGHLPQEPGGGLVFAEQHQLQVEVPLQQEALGHQPHPHDAPQGARGLVPGLAGTEEEERKYHPR